MKGLSLLGQEHPGGNVVGFRRSS